MHLDNMIYFALHVWTWSCFTFTTFYRVCFQVCSLLILSLFNIYTGLVNIIPTRLFIFLPRKYCRRPNQQAHFSCVYISRTREYTCRRTVVNYSFVLKLFFNEKQLAFFKFGWKQRLPNYCNWSVLNGIITLRDTM